MERIKEINFAARFKQIHSLDRDAKFCFILGAGASHSSGIRTGQQLSALWLKEINESGIFNDADIANWKAKFGIDESRPELFYGEIYAKRFSDYKKLGYKVLAQEIDNKQPSIGYSVLAQIMAGERHNVVITTNFDNLIEAALYTFTDKKPVVCGHESLAGYANPSQELPLIVKIHRDLLFHPKNDKEETSNLAEEWLDALTKIFSTHIPVFIGYGGNDGSLMGYLDKLDPISKLYWCLYNDEQPTHAINEVVKKHNGLFVETNGFDSLMYKLLQTLGYEYAFNSLENKAKARVDSYLEQVKKITNESYGKPMKKLGWGDYEVMIGAARSIDEKKEIYRKGIGETESPELMGNYANFLKDMRKDYDQAETFYKKSLELGAKDATHIGNYAVFLDDIRKDYDQAETLYRKALELAPRSATDMGNYALFLHVNRKDYEQAKTFYMKALELDSNNAVNIANYANLLMLLKDYDQAGTFYGKALELDPNNTTHVGNHSLFLGYHQRQLNRILLQKNIRTASRNAVM